MAGIFDGQCDETRNINAQHGKRSVPRKQVQSCAEIVAKYWRLYCKHSSLVGLKYFVKDEATWFEKFLWFLAYMFAMFVVLKSTLTIYQDDVTPITSTQEAEYFPTQELEFPAVAVCSINRISLRSATRLATEMFDAKISNLTVDEIVKEIWKLGDLYESDFVQADDYTQITQLLSKFYNNNYDVTDIMEYLTPQCSDMFLFCKFHNEKYDCSELFAVGKTHNGFCCTFNYVPEVDDIPKFSNRVEPQIRLVGAIGKYYGLSVVMKPILDDYFYTILPTTGWKVMIFNSYDYPDASTGSVSEVLVAPLTEEFIQLKAVRLYSIDTIRSYPVQQRGCIFPNEQVSGDTVYTWNECIIACKLVHVWEHCKCRPFFYPRQGSSESSRRTCTLEDIQCLIKYYGKPYDIVPYEDPALMELVKDKDAAVICNNCYSECYDMTYIVQSSAFDLSTGFYKGDHFPAINVTEHSILHIYFWQYGTVFMKRDETFRWYERLSDVGGMYGLIIGFSIISLLEMLFITVTCFFEILKPHKIIKNEIPHKNPMQPIYWNEILSHPPINA